MSTENMVKDVYGTRKWTPVCPGLPGHPPGACPHPPEPGDRYCAGCRAEFDSQRDEGW